MVVVHSGLLPSANSDSAQPVKAVRNVSVEGAACWNGWKKITHMHIHSEVTLYKVIIMHHTCGAACGNSCMYMYCMYRHIRSYMHTYTVELHIFRDQYDT